MKLLFTAVARGMDEMETDGWMDGWIDHFSRGVLISKIDVAEISRGEPILI